VSCCFRISGKGFDLPTITGSTDGPFDSWSYSVVTLISKTFDRAAWTPLRVEKERISNLLLVVAIQERGRT
jgi:hypothetical protein